MLNGIGTPALLLCFVASVFGMATFRVGKQTFQYHTQDLLEVKVSPYTMHDIAICLDTARSALNSVKFDNITSVIIAIDAIEAQEFGCKAATYAGFAVSKLNQYLNATSGFSIDMALYIANTNSGPGFVNIALLPHDNYQAVLDASNKLSAAVTVTIDEESGPWNDAFLSTGYRFCKFVSLDQNKKNYY
ncbi:hypothetical protein BDF19DRAFT_423966 [Syncephalis fuscata]|nr:hypothetical protein BDF19DRAFT_423966 [Syncephalis fuscata]